MYTFSIDTSDPPDVMCIMAREACLSSYVSQRWLLMCRDREANVAQAGKNSSALHVYVQNPQSSVRRVAIIRLFEDRTDGSCVWF